MANLTGKLVKFYTWIEPGPGTEPPAGPYTGLVERDEGELWIRCTDVEFVRRTRQFYADDGGNDAGPEYYTLAVVDPEAVGSAAPDGVGVTLLEGEAA